MSAGYDVTAVVAKVVACGALIGCIVIGVLGNGVMCHLVNRKAAMRSAINLLLTSISVSNLLLSTTCTPLLVATIALEEWVFGQAVSRLVASLTVLFVAASVYALLAISLDRYLIIVRRKDRLTPQRAKGVITAVWGLALVVALPLAVGGGLYYPYCSVRGNQCAQQGDFSYVIVFDVVVFFLPMVLMMYTYVCIIQSVRHDLSQVFNPREATPPNTVASSAFRNGAYSSSIPGHITVSPSEPSPSPASASASVSRIHRCRASQRIHYVDINFKTRSFRTIFILFVVFVVCWLPFSVAVLVASIQTSTMTQRNCYVTASTTMTQQNCNVKADAMTVQRMFGDTIVTQRICDVMVDATKKHNTNDVIIDTMVKLNNNDDMTDITSEHNTNDVVNTTMQQQNSDVSDYERSSQKSNFYFTAVWMTTVNINSDVTASVVKAQYSCDVTDKTMTTKRDNRDLDPPGKLHGAAMVALVTLCVGCANCAINPFVFWLKIHKYRSACLEYLPCGAANSHSSCGCYCGGISTNAIDISGMDVEGLPPRLSFRTRRQIHPDAAYKCKDENEDTTAT